MSFATSGCSQLKRRQRALFKTTRYANLLKCFPHAVAYLVFETKSARVVYK